MNAAMFSRPVWRQELQKKENMGTLSVAAQGTDQCIDSRHSSQNPRKVIELGLDDREMLRKSQLAA